MKFQENFFNFFNDIYLNTHFFSLCLQSFGARPQLFQAGQPSVLQINRMRWCIELEQAFLLLFQILANKAPWKPSVTQPRGSRPSFKIFKIFPVVGQTSHFKTQDRSSETIAKCKNIYMKTLIKEKLVFHGLSKADSVISHIGYNFKIHIICKWWSIWLICL